MLSEVLLNYDDEASIWFAKPAEFLLEQLGIGAFLFLCMFPFKEGGSV